MILTILAMDAIQIRNKISKILAMDVTVIKGRIIKNSVGASGKKEIVVVEGVTDVAVAEGADVATFYGDGNHYK